MSSSSLAAAIPAQDHFGWEEKGRRLKPIILFAVRPLAKEAKPFVQDAITSISFLQPNPIRKSQWDFGLPLECSVLCNTIRQDPFFRWLHEPKYPRVFQLDPGGICWVPQNYLGVAVLLLDQDIDVTLVSYCEASSCTHKWMADQNLYLSQSGFKAPVRVKFAVVLLQLNKRPPTTTHPISQVNNFNFQPNTQPNTSSEMELDMPHGIQPNLQPPVQPRYESSYQQPNFQQSSFQLSGFQQPSYQQPGFQQTSFQQPGFHQSTFQLPGFQQPGGQQPGFQQTDNQITFQYSGYQQPDNQTSYMSNYPPNPS